MLRYFFHDYSILVKTTNSKYFEIVQVLFIFLNLFQGLDVSLKRITKLKPELSIMFFSVDEPSKKIYCQCAVSAVRNYFVTFVS